MLNYFIANCYIRIIEYKYFRKISKIHSSINHRYDGNLNNC